MSDLILKIIMGILLMFLGIMNYKGNINSIHWYNRKRITEATKKPYGRLMGMGTGVIGLGLIITSVLEILFDINEMNYLMIGSIIIGLALILYAQIKYNKGIF